MSPILNRIKIIECNRTFIDKTPASFGFGVISVVLSSACRGQATQQSHVTPEASEAT